MAKQVLRVAVGWRGSKTTVGDIDLSWLDPGRQPQKATAPALALSQVGSGDQDKDTGWGTNSCKA
jgi:hypothetical protein